VSQPGLRAPTEDGAVLAVPPLEQVGALVEANHARLRRPDRQLLGRPWPDLQREARAAALEAAARYLSERGEPGPTPSDRLLLAGHQPELFHPGVWVKNFALVGMARRHGGVPLNLVVDNDNVKSTAVHVPTPTGTPGEVRYRPVPFDRWSGAAPWEERPVADPAVFDSAGERIQDVMAGWGIQSLMPTLWPRARQARQRGEVLGECFAFARRSLERDWGSRPVEVPLSRLCDTAPFAWFAGHLVLELPRFHALYNEAVHAYRKVHRLRSRHHPVPDLAADGDWLEAPFWAWRTGQTQRHRLFARAWPDRVELRVGGEVWAALPRRPEGCVEAWRGLAGQGKKLRTRALTTTMYARLFLGELFVHGIGGAKYDELTDEIVRRFFTIEPPAFLVLSATRLLPLRAPEVGEADRQRLARALRDLHWNPQRHLPPGQRHQAAAAEKQQWMGRTPADRPGRRERFRRLRALTEQLRPTVAGQAAELRGELARVERELEARAVLRRRDYCFCLYPDSVLRPFCTAFL
jgi:hypothetical protein